MPEGRAYHLAPGRLKRVLFRRFYGCEVKSLINFVSGEQVDIQSTLILCYFFHNLSDMGSVDFQRLEPYYDDFLAILQTLKGINEFPIVALPCPGTDLYWTKELTKDKKFTLYRMSAVNKQGILLRILQQVGYNLPNNEFYQFTYTADKMVLKHKNHDEKENWFESETNSMSRPQEFTAVTVTAIQEFKIL